MTNSEKILNAALELLGRGFSVIPVHPITKAALVKWKQYQSRLPTEEEIIGWWQAWPNANVAIVTGGISEIWVADGDSVDAITWMATYLPATGVYSVSGRGQHAYFRVPSNVRVKNDSKGIFHPDVHIKGEGGYAVAPPSVHETGHVYEWKFILDGWDDLTELDPKDILAKVKKDQAVPGGNGSGDLNLDLTDVKILPINEPVKKGERNNRLTQLAGSWIAKGLDDDEVEILAHSWNQGNNPPLKEAEVLKTLKSIRSIDDSKQLGNPDVVIDESAEMFGGFNNNIADHFLNPGGILQEMLDHIEVNSAVVNRFFSLGACLTVLGAAAGQKFMTQTKLRTNLYAVGIGASGTGKDAPFKALTGGLVARCPAGQILGPTDVTSATAILRHMSTDYHPVTLMMIDEFGMMMKGVKNKNGHSSTIPRLMMEMFSADKHHYKKLAKEEYNMPWHHLSVYGATTPTEFWEALGSDEASNGFLARLLLFETYTKVPLPRTLMGDIYSPSLEKQIGDIFTMARPIDEKRGDIARVPMPKMIPRSLEANEFQTELEAKYNKLANRFLYSSRSERSTIYNRCAEHVQKLSLIHAISKDGIDVKEIGIGSVKWAAELIDFIAANTIFQMELRLGGSDQARAWAQIADGVRGFYHQHHKGATKSNMYTFTKRTLDSKQLDILLRSMIEAGAIAVQKENRGNNVRDIFYPVKDKREN